MEQDFFPRNKESDLTPHLAQNSITSLSGSIVDR